MFTLHRLSGLPAMLVRLQGERGLMRLFSQWGAFLKLPADKTQCVIFGNAL
jgi:hypothetical protein